MLTPESTLRKDRANAAKTATFEHRHFAVIAGIIREELEHGVCGEDQRDAVRNVADRFARRLVNTNPRFDRTRFLKACGIES
jgi:hypothetical protein